MDWEFAAGSWKSEGGPSSPNRGVGCICAQPLHLTLHDRTRQHRKKRRQFAGNMSDDREKSKGISLRKKRTKHRPKEVSAPRKPQISAPLPAGLAAAQGSNRPSEESNRPGTKLDAPRERPQRADKTADLVKRRYSQKILQLPSDFGNGAPMPDMPAIPSQYRSAPSGRDVRPPPSSDGRSLKVDVKALRDPNFKPDQCMFPGCPCGA
jgi:hypothetical protein